MGRNGVTSRRGAGRSGWRGWRTGLLLLMANCGTTPAVDPAGDPRDLSRRIATTVTRVLNERQIPGAVVSVGQGHHFLQQYAFGWRDLALHEPMTCDTLFPVGSITKPMTSAALASLIEQGRLTWETPLREALSPGLELPAEVGAITLRQLAAHTSGLPALPHNWTTSVKPLAADGAAPHAYTNHDLIEALRTATLAPVARGKCSYSNFGSALLGVVLEQASGRSFAAALEALLFEPAGMRESGIAAGPAHAARMAHGYSWGERRLVAQSHTTFGDVASVGGVYSSAADLTRFCAAQLDGGPWRRETLADLHRPIASVQGFAGRASTTGWFLETIDGFGHLLAHVGEIDGISSCIAIDLATGTHLVILANADGNAAELIARALMQQLGRSDGTWRL